MRLISRPLKTNKVSNTAFRGFGGPQGMMLAERVIQEVAFFLGKDPLDIKKMNLYGTGKKSISPYYQKISDNISKRIIMELENSSNYKKRRKEVLIFNKNNIFFKKGIALTPVKFGISFTATWFNQGGALVHVYTDGSVIVNHGGTEMGQGLHTKVLGIITKELGVSLDKIKITDTDTSKIANTSATAASSGSDLNGMAAWNASNVIKNRMIDHAAKLFKKNKKDIVLGEGRIICGNRSLSFSELAFSCWENRISLSSTGYYKTPKISWDQGKLRGHPYFYFTWGAAISEALLDINTGESRILRADIVQDCGNSLNENIDIGQIEGGFIQGLGWLTCEELCFSKEGKLLTTGPSTYKLPGSRDIPQIFNVKLLEKADNEEKTIFRSKAVGEPPLLLAISHFLALKEAIRASSTNSRPELLNSPATPSEILKVLKV